MMPEDRDDLGPGRPTPGDRWGGGRLSDSARVEAFSDGVLAIVITLLVLSLRAPQGPHMLAQLGSQWPAYLAYLASFGYVGVIWVNHHQLFTRIAAVLERQIPPSFFATERRRALLGVIAYLIAALVAIWLPIVSLFIVCGLPVFYGLTTEGWKGR